MRARFISKFVFTVAFCVALLNATAQEKGGIPNDLDKQFTPGKNALFGESSNSSSSDGEIYADFKNSIKWNITLLGRSTFAMFYERALSDQISMEFGIGTNYSKDRIFEALGGGDFYFDQSNNYNEMGFDEYLRRANFTSSSIFLSAQAKFYLGGWYNESSVFDGSYFAIGTRFNPYKFELYSDPYDPNYSYSDAAIQGSKTSKLKTTSIYMLWGWQGYTSGKLKTTHDLYTGFGFRTTKYETFTRNEGLDPYGYSTGSPYYTKSAKEASAFGMTFLIGYAFGFGF